LFALIILKKYILFNNHFLFISEANHLLNYHIIYLEYFWEHKIYGATEQHKNSWFLMSSIYLFNWWWVNLWNSDDSHRWKYFMIIWTYMKKLWSWDVFNDQNILSYGIYLEKFYSSLAILFDNCCDEHMMIKTKHDWWLFLWNGGGKFWKPLEI
jgi:hypothetical protein